MVSSKNLLFHNIEESDRKSMMLCFHSRLKQYSAGEIISFYSEDDMGIGIVENGDACVVHCLPNGSRTILENLNEGDIFGQLFYFHAARENITVEATKNCLIRYIDYEHIIKRCSKACAHHSQLVNNILLMIQDKTQKICEHLEILSQRTIRDKIYTFFEILSVKNGSRQFEIPFTISNMADYLSVDRSAMSRELGKMKQEGIIKMNRRHVTLL